jgi:hypothetical protein
VWTKSLVKQDASFSPGGLKLPLNETQKHAINPHKTTLWLLLEHEKQDSEKTLAVTVFCEYCYVEKKEKKSVTVRTIALLRRELLNTGYLYAQQREAACAKDLVKNKCV